MPAGTLYLIPVPLAEQAAARSFTPYLVDAINQLKEYIVENEKTARRFLKEAGLKIPQSELIIHDYGKHNRDNDINTFFKGLVAGNDVGLMSEAGCPGIADPGQLLIAAAQEMNCAVKPLTGPSSILLALMASGMNGQQFEFLGYLPIDNGERIKKIKELEQASAKNNSTQIFIETPYRNNQLLETLLQHCAASTKICIGVNITAVNESIVTQTAAAWKKKKPELHKQPAIFLLYAGK